MHAYLASEAIVWFSSMLVTGGVTLVDGSSSLDACCVVMFSVGAVCVTVCIHVVRIQSKGDSNTISLCTHMLSWVEVL